VPTQLGIDGIERAISAFVSAARRADAAGYRWIEIHAAHGYLLHSFNSDLSNQRADDYGGSLEGRCRITREVARGVRRVLPAEKVLAFRLSFTDWVEGGWVLEDTLQLAKWLKDDGVDFIDVSSGGNTPHPAVRPSPGYQVPGAEAIRKQVGIPVAAVGLIDDPLQANAIVEEGRADLVMLAREMLRDPYWPFRAAVALGDTEHARVPVQYSAAWARHGSFQYDPINAPQVTRSGIDRIDQARHLLCVPAHSSGAV
jgi:2,4-dienoyl-CoA reductase-like NADH-dependent reductase (Old Yellow Enzyme family)